MKLVELLLKFLREILPAITGFVAGRKSKELENIKDENEKLKKYQAIDDSNQSSADDAYTASLWK